MRDKVPIILSFESPPVQAIVFWTSTFASCTHQFFW